MMKNNAVIYELITESQGDLAVRMREVFDRGYEQGLKDNSEEAYQKGLDDAWECARTIVNYMWNSGCSEVKKVFDTYSIYVVLNNYSASEAISKIKAFEEQKKAEKEEIKVGTRVRTTKDKDYSGEKLFPVGTVGIIQEICLKS